MEPIHVYAAGPAAQARVEARQTRPANPHVQKVVKAVFALLASLALVGFTLAFAATMNPLFLIGSAVALGVLLSLGGVQARVTYVNRRVQADPFYATYYAQTPARRGFGDFFSSSSRSRAPAFRAEQREVIPPTVIGTAARGNGVQGGFHAPVGTRRT